MVLITHVLPSYVGIGSNQWRSIGDRLTREVANPYALGYAGPGHQTAINTYTLNTMERPLSTDTKSAIEGTRMSEAATPAVAAGNWVSTTRIVGGAGVALAASVVVQNAVFFWPRNAPPTPSSWGR